MTEQPELSVPKGTKVLTAKEQRLADLSVGMTKVDPADIRPPAILMRQKSSEADAYKNSKGEMAKLGQYYHTGRQTIMDKVGCYFVFAAKSMAKNKRQPAEPEKPLYRAIGCMADDLTPFSMIFRSSSLYTLSPLFTYAVSHNKPMYAVQCTLDKKELTNTDGSWHIPVLKIEGIETEDAKLDKLYELAKQLDNRITVGEADDENDLAVLLGPKT